MFVINVLKKNRNLNLRGIEMNLKKRTEKIRYNSVLLIVKHITPSLYQKILPIISNNVKLLSKVPRPSILFMKEYFNQDSVIGAEIGVDKGRNAKSILTELNIDKLYLVDAWFNYKEIQANRPQKTNFKFVLREFENDKRVEIIRAFSINAVKEIVDNSLDFVYIDANHLYEFVYQDINLWYNKVKKGGIIAGHDIFGHIGVLKAVKRFCNEKNYVFNIEIPDWYFIKGGLK
ncbi:O-methyltransferase [Lokiarchaeota virus WyrdV1]|nr:O-methyltransferase [Lokiarchaeota virus WyrdV1]